jgi:hypothetical protein
MAAPTITLRGGNPEELAGADARGAAGLGAALAAAPEPMAVTAARNALRCTMARILLHPIRDQNVETAALL